MSVKRLFVAGGVLALAASSANAAFTFRTERAPATGSFAGFDRVNLIVSSDTPNYALGGLALDITAADQPNGLKFRVPAVGNPDVYPPDFAGQTASTFNPGAKGTFGGYSSELGAVTLATPEPNAAAKPAYSAGLPTINYVAFFTTPLDVTTTDIPGGLVIGSAVVPAGTTVTFGGTIDNDLESNNGSTPIVQTNTGTDVPEPMGLAALGLVGMAAFGRRRRQA
jgi:hypothetical protein